MPFHSILDNTQGGQTDRSSRHTGHVTDHVTTVFLGFMFGGRRRVVVVVVSSCRRRRDITV